VAAKGGALAAAFGTTAASFFGRHQLPSAVSLLHRTIGGIAPGIA